MGKIIGLLLLSGLSGCAGSLVATQKDARLSYDRAVADYKNCLATNPAIPQRCESNRAAMVAEEQHYINLSNELDMKMHRSMLRSAIIGQ